MNELKKAEPLKKTSKTIIVSYSEITQNYFQSHIQLKNLGARKKQQDVLYSHWRHYRDQNQLYFSVLLRIPYGLVSR